MTLAFASVVPVTFVVATVVFLLLCTASLSKASGLLLVWPSVVAHELAHWVVALLTGCRPGPPQLIAKRKSDGSIVLGEVEFTPRPFFSAWVCLAPPLLLGTSAWFLLVHPLTDVLSPLYLGLSAGYLAWGAKPSAQDVSIALKDPLGLLTVSAVVYCTSHLVR